MLISSFPFAINWTEANVPGNPAHGALFAG